MKHLLIAIATFLTFCVTTGCYTQATSYVIDQSSILDSLQRARLNSLYKKHEKITTNQIVLLTRDDFYPDSTIENYALHEFNRLEIGQKGINNGVLIVFSAPMRTVRIATGYGTEKILTDSIAKKIIDSLMIPEFKREKYFKGLWDGSIALTSFLEKPENKIK